MFISNFQLFKTLSLIMQYFTQRNSIKYVQFAIQTLRNNCILIFTLQKEIIIFL